LDRQAAPVAAIAPLTLANAAGCQATGTPTILAPGTQQADGLRDPKGARITQGFSCGQLGLTVTVQAFSTRTNPETITLARRELAREGIEDMEFGSLSVPDATPASWRLAVASKESAMTATALWIEGEPARGGLGERIRQARNSIAGAAAAPVLVAAGFTFPRSPMHPQEREAAQKRLAQFLAAQADLSAQVAALARAAARSDKGG
jgi:hypothetical protein